MILSIKAEKAAEIHRRWAIFRWTSQCTEHTGQCGATIRSDTPAQVSTAPPGPLLQPPAATNMHPPLWPRVLRMAHVRTTTQRVTVDPAQQQAS